MMYIRWCLLKHTCYSSNNFSLLFPICHITKRLCSAYKTQPETENDKNKLFPVDKIRNFSIIAHIDHGKSTLADRLLEHTGAIKQGEKHAQVLDQLQVERERGITVKAVTASLNFIYNNENYLLNLIDTPGHVDFSSEVVRSVQACQGAILLVDAAEGPRAQTVAVHSLATKNNLFILPVLNKIDLPRADPIKSKNQLFSLFNIEPNDVLEVSAKKGWGIDKLLEAIVLRIPPPNVNRNGYLKAFVFDTWVDRYRGVLCLAYIEKGCLKLGDSVKWSSANKTHIVKHLYLLTPEEKPITEVGAGQVVLFSLGPRGGGAVGEMLLSTDAPMDKLVNKFERSQTRHMVYAGIFPISQAEYISVKSAVDKVATNDSGVSVTDDSSPALGQGWRVGFSGLLHMEVFTQRLFQEHKAEAVISAPSVPCKIKLSNPKLIKKHKSEVLTITNPCMLPSHLDISEYYEPFVKGTIFIPIKYYGSVTSLCFDRRGVPLGSKSIDDDNIILYYHLPLSEILVDFHDILKSITSGYANFDYYDDGFHKSNLVKLDILLNGEKVNELTSIIHTSRLEYYGRRLVEQLKEKMDRQMITIAIQAVVNDGRVIARETLKQYRKDVTAKLYGGDVTRRMKLLRAQSEGKKRMKSEASVHLPRETLVEVLRKK